VGEAAGRHPGEEVEEPGLSDEQGDEELFALRRPLVVEVVVYGLDELRRLREEVLAEHGLGDGEEDERRLRVEVFELGRLDLDALLRVGYRIQCVQ
jgi:hypothetical protein